MLLLAATLSLLLTPGPALATPWSGPEPTPSNLLFYLHNSSAGVTIGSAQYLNVLSTVNDSQAPWTRTGSVSLAAHYDAVDFVAAPAFTAPLALNGTVNATVYLNQSGSSPTGGSITLTVGEVAPTGAVTLLGTGPATGTGSIGPGGSIPTLVFLTGPTLTATIPAGSSLELNITINGNTAEHYGIWWGRVTGTYYGSSASVPSSTYLTVPTVEVLTSSGAAVTVLPGSTANTTVTVRAVVADPLGAYDFENYTVDFSVVTAQGSVVVAPRAMSPTPSRALPSAPNGTYSLAFNYSGLAAGRYRFTVNATDDTDHNLANQNTLPTYYGRNAFAAVTISIGLPPVPVRLTVVDDHDVALRGALVGAISGGTQVASGRTNGTGVVTFQLAAGAVYDFPVQWEGIGVGSFSETVTANSTQFTLHVEVVYPTFAVLASNGQPLPYPLITVIHPNGTAYRLIVGTAAGQFSLAQVPVGNYTLTVVYDDSQVVFAEPVLVTGDGPFLITAHDVFALTVHATASGGGGLSNVFVAVVNTTTGSTVASGITDGSGTLTFLVPAGSYNITGRWAETYDLTPLQQTVTATVGVTGPSVATLVFTKAYPSVFATTLFSVVLVVVLLLAAIAVLAGLWLRARRGGPPPPAANPPAEWKEDADTAAKPVADGKAPPSPPE